jgi:YD repeat-containing protein
MKVIILDETSGDLKEILASFASLSDTPSSYTGAGGKVVAVKATEDGLEFIDAPSGGGGGDYAILGSSNQDVNLFMALNQQIDTRTTEVTYDAGGNVSTVVEKNGETIVKTTTLTYDANGNLTTVTEEVAGQTITTTLSYDANGNVTSITRSVS